MPPPRDYAFAVEQRAFIDATRSTPVNGDAPASAVRTLPATIWRPQGAGPFPLVLFVHGSSGFRRQSTWLTEALARDGYLVAAADFPLTALATPGGASDWDVQQQPLDLRFLADQLGAAAYAVVGHSTGGAVALLAAQAPDAHDPRLRAAVVLSGDSCFFGEAFFRTRAVPTLFISASRDLLVPPAGNGLRAFALTQPPRLHAMLLGGTHLFFTDLALPDDLGGPPAPTTPAAPLAQTLSRYGGGAACTPVAPPAGDAPLAFEAQHLLAARVTAAFLDEQFRGEAVSFEALADPRLVLAR